MNSELNQKQDLDLRSHLATVLNNWLSENPSSPGVQCALLSRRHDLDLTIAIQSRSFKKTHDGVRPLLQDTPWRIASITKTFVSFAVLKLCELGNVHLDSPAQKYLPDWAVSYLKDLTKDYLEIQSEPTAITVRMLLQHNSGLYDYISDPLFEKEILLDPKHLWTVREILDFAVKNGKPVAKAGERFHYSDTGYTFLGILLAHVTGKDLASAVLDLANPKNMELRSTWWEIFQNPPDGVHRQIANQYQGDVDVTTYNASFDSYGGGGLVSTAAELNRFTQAVHVDGMLQFSTMRQLYTTIPIPSDSYITPGASEYGLGWIKSISHGHMIWWHLGYWGSWTAYVPELDLSFSGTMNQGENSFPLASIILGTVLSNLKGENQ